MSQAVLLCHLNDLPEYGARGFDPAGLGRDTLFVVRRGTELYAYRDSCPHLPGMPLPWRKNAYLDSRSEAIVCAAHGARFDVASGKCFIGPCKGESLSPLPLSLSDDGQLLVRLEETLE